MNYKLINIPTQYARKEILGVLWRESMSGASGKGVRNRLDPRAQLLSKDMKRVSYDEREQ